MPYIERDDENDNTSITSTTVDPSSESSENKKRWDWLVNGWAKMTFKQKLGLFMPYLHYVNSRDYYKKDFDNYFSEEMINTAYSTCRDFIKLKFDPDGQGVPNIIMVFGPINPSRIPDATIKAEVKAFGIMVGMYSEYSPCPCDC